MTLSPDMVATVLAVDFETCVGGMRHVSYGFLRFVAEGSNPDEVLRILKQYNLTQPGWVPAWINCYR